MIYKRVIYEKGNIKLTFRFNLNITSPPSKNISLIQI